MEWTVASGVHTHKDVHGAGALDALGAQLDSQEIATTPAGYRRLLSWAQELGVPAFAIEGTGSYGAGSAAMWGDLAVRERQRALWGVRLAADECVASTHAVPEL